MNATLLVELFTEELPPKALKQLGEAFGLRLQDGLIRAQLKDQAIADTRIFATPRRLAVLIPRVRAKAENRAESKKLMPSKVAFDADGKPSAALAKRLEKEGATVDQYRAPGRGRCRIRLPRADDRGRGALRRLAACVAGGNSQTADT